MPWRAAGLALLLAMAPVSGAKAEPRDAFTTEMAGRFKSTYPDVTVAIAEPLTLVLARGDQNIRSNLDRIYKVCQTNGTDMCSDAKTGFVNGIGQQIAAMTNPAAIATRREDLRLLVREAGYCAEIERLMANGPVPAKPVTAAFVGDTCLILMFDMPTSRRTTLLDELAPLGLTRDAAWQLAQAQVLAPLPKLASIDVPENSLNAFTTFPDVTSLMLDTQGWSALASRHPGKQIIVTIPDDGMMSLLIVAPDFELTGLAKITREAFDSAQRGISPQLLRWSAQGWQVIP